MHGKVRMEHVILLRFAQLHSELLSLLEVSNANHTAKQQGREALLKRLKQRAIANECMGDCIFLPA